MKNSRRDFLRKSLSAAVGSSSLYGFGTTLNLASAALNADKGINDYKALVCLFLDGGNDSFNMLVPTEATAYGHYLNARNAIALSSGPNGPQPPQNNGTVLGLNGANYGLHPSMPGLQNLYNQGKVAFANNIGTLIEPVSKTQIHNGNANLPPQLFSHSDQQKQWEMTSADSGTPQGWLGIAADMLESMNQTNIPLNISLTGTRTLQIGANTTPYNLSAWGLQDFNHRNNGSSNVASARDQVFQDLIYQGYSHPMMQAYAQTYQDTMGIYETLADDLRTAPDIPAGVGFPADEWLSLQLQTVARVIASQQTGSVNRQIFLVHSYGWDFHDSLLAAQNYNLGIVDQCVSAFYNTLNSPGWTGLSDKVTTFSMSEFGRTLTSNGDGTDHAWGGNQFVVGDAVQGGMFGTYPSLELNGPDDVGEGRIIPTTSVEQFASTLIRWLGVSDAELQTVFPNLSNFNSNHMGFML